ncbi:cobaltochelatase subunit CobN, partial [Nostoc sp. NIES-2111]
LDDTVEAVDLAQSPADIVFLSFTDSDLALMAAAWERAGEGAPTLRLANLALLRHPYSVDLHVEKGCARARFVLVRLLGGMDYWRYGVEQLSDAARRHGFQLAVVPGDHMEDPRLDAASTMPVEELRRLWGWFQCGGLENAASCLGWIGSVLGREMPWSEPEPLPSAGLFAEACRPAPERGSSDPQLNSASEDARSGRALIVLYRAHVASADTAPIIALADALAARDIAVDAVFVTSLKDPSAAMVLERHIATHPPDVILNATAFSGRLDEGGSVLDRADRPVLQVILAGSTREAWESGTRGLSAADLAMNVVLPEADGRIVTTAISFKEPAPRSEVLQFSRLVHTPDAGRVAHVADLAAAWVRLGRMAPAQRRLALVMSDYPGTGGREGYAVGLDTPASIGCIASALRAAGYAVGDLPEGDGPRRALAGGGLRAPAGGAPPARLCPPPP